MASATAILIPSALYPVLPALPEDISRGLTKLLTLQHIAINVDNIAGLLKHSPGPGCFESLPHIPLPRCPVPDLAIPRALILPLIERTIELCHESRSGETRSLENNQAAIDMVEGVEKMMAELRAYAGDDLAALEYNLLRSFKMTVLDPAPNGAVVPPATGSEASQGTGSSFSSHRLPMVPAEQTKPQVLATPPSSTEEAASPLLTMETTMPEVNIVIKDPKFISKLLGMKKSQLSKLLEQDLQSQGLAADIHQCSFRAKWGVVSVQFSNTADTHAVIERWKPCMFGEGALVENKRERLPWSKEAELLSEIQMNARVLKIVIQDRPFAKSQLATIHNKELTQIINRDLKDQGITVPIERCKKSDGCAHVRLWAVKLEDVQVLSRWKPNLQRLFGDGAELRT